MRSRLERGAGGLIQPGNQGTLSADGTSIDVTWTQRQPVPLVLRRATPETAWKDPAAHSIRFVTADKNVELEVLGFDPVRRLQGS